MLLINLYLLRSIKKKGRGLKSIKLEMTKEKSQLTPPKYKELWETTRQIRSVTQSCPTLCDPMNRSMPGLRVHHQLPEFTQTHIHWVSDAIQPSHPLSSPSPPAPNSSQHQSFSNGIPVELFQILKDDAVKLLHSIC